MIWKDVSVLLDLDGDSAMGIQYAKNRWNFKQGLRWGMEFLIAFVLNRHIAKRDTLIWNSSFALNHDSIVISGKGDAEWFDWQNRDSK